MVWAHNVDELHQVFIVSGLVADIQNILQDHAVYVWLFADGFKILNRKWLWHLIANCLLDYMELISNYESPFN